MPNTISEVQLPLKRKLESIVSRINGELSKGGYRHDVIYLPLKGDGTYVLDLAGAQYGQHKALVPLTQYLDTFIADIGKAEQPLGHKA